MAERIQKVLARAGVASRRQVEALVAAGRVRVNGERAVLGQRIDPHNDKVQVDGSVVPLHPDLVYYLVNKPRGVVATAHDPQGRPTVVDLVDAGARVWPVGRLDADSEGLLLLTNDGDLTQALTHPSFEVARTYLVEVAGKVARPALGALARGIELEDGPTRPAEVKVRGSAAGRTLVEITIREGRNRQVRRMFAAVGHPVVSLVRISLGPLMLGHLKPGAVRRLGPAEIRELYRACGL